MSYKKSLKYFKYNKSTRRKHTEHDNDIPGDVFMGVVLSVGETEGVVSCESEAVGVYGDTIGVPVPVESALHQNFMTIYILSIRLSSIKLCLISVHTW